MRLWAYIPSSGTMNVQEASANGLSWLLRQGLMQVVDENKGEELDGGVSSAMSTNTGKEWQARATEMYNAGIQEEAPGLLDAAANAFNQARAQYEVEAAASATRAAQAGTGSNVAVGAGDVRTDTALRSKLEDLSHNALLCAGLAAYYKAALNSDAKSKRASYEAAATKLLLVSGSPTAAVRLAQSLQRCEEFCAAAVVYAALSKPGFLPNPKRTAQFLELSVQLYQRSGDAVSAARLLARHNEFDRARRVLQKGRLYREIMQLTYYANDMQQTLLGQHKDAAEWNPEAATLNSQVQNAAVGHEPSAADRAHQRKKLGTVSIRDIAREAALFYDSRGDEHSLKEREKFLRILDKGTADTLVRTKSRDRKAVARMLLEQRQVVQAAHIVMEKPAETIDVARGLDVLCGLDMLIDDKAKVQPFDRLTGAIGAASMSLKDATGLHAFSLRVHLCLRMFTSLEALSWTQHARLDAAPVSKPSWAQLDPSAVIAAAQRGCMGTLQAACRLRDQLLSAVNDVPVTASWQKKLQQAADTCKWSHRQLFEAVLALVHGLKSLPLECRRAVALRAGLACSGCLNQALICLVVGDEALVEKHPWLHHAYTIIDALADVLMESVHGLRDAGKVLHADAALVEMASHEVAVLAIQATDSLLSGRDFGTVDKAPVVAACSSCASKLQLVFDMLKADRKGDSDSHISKDVRHDALFGCGVQVAVMMRAVDALHRLLDAAHAGLPSHDVTTLLTDLVPFLQASCPNPSKGHVIRAPKINALLLLLGGQRVEATDDPGADAVRCGVFPVSSLLVAACQRGRLNDASKQTAATVADTLGGREGGRLTIGEACEEIASYWRGLMAQVYHDAQGLTALLTALPNLAAPMRTSQKMASAISLLEPAVRARDIVDQLQGFNDLAAFCSRNVKDILKAFGGMKNAPAHLKRRLVMSEGAAGGAGKVIGIQSLVEYCGNPLSFTDSIEKLAAEDRHADEIRLVANAIVDVCAIGPTLGTIAVRPAGHTGIIALPSGMIGSIVKHARDKFGLPPAVANGLNIESLAYCIRAIKSDDDAEKFYTGVDDMVWAATSADWALQYATIAAAAYTPDTPDNSVADMERQMHAMKESILKLPMLVENNRSRQLLAMKKQKQQSFVFPELLVDDVKNKCLDAQLANYSLTDDNFRFAAIFLTSALTSRSRLGLLPSQQTITKASELTLQDPPETAVYNMSHHLVEVNNFIAACFIPSSPAMQHDLINPIMVQLTPPTTPEGFGASLDLLESVVAPALIIANEISSAGTFGAAAPETYTLLPACYVERHLNCMVPPQGGRPGDYQGVTLPMLLQLGRDFQLVSRDHGSGTCSAVPLQVGCLASAAIRILTFLKASCGTQRRSWQASCITCRPRSMRTIAAKTPRVTQQGQSVSTTLMARC